MEARVVAGGIVPLDPRGQGVENINFNSFSIGTNANELNQANNTFQWIDNFSKVVGLHTLKFGVEFHYDQINTDAISQANGLYILGEPDRFDGLRLSDFCWGSEPVQPEPIAAVLPSQ